MRQTICFDNSQCHSNTHTLESAQTVAAAPPIDRGAMASQSNLARSRRRRRTAPAAAVVPVEPVPRELAGPGTQVN